MQRNAPVKLPLATHAHVTGGTATGSTELTAFDAALQSAGIHNANLLSISSVMPAGATVETDDSPESIEARVTPGGFYPTVYAAEASERSGAVVHAAVAGCTLESGYGINVERHGTGGDRESVHAACEGMLAELAANRDETITDETWFRFESTTVPDDAWACAVAAVLYR